MATEQSIEAARSRIQRLVDEIAALSKKEMRSEEFFQQFLTRAVQATDGRGGAVWLVSQRASDGRSEFQLAAQVEFETSLFHSDEQQHAILLRSLGEVVQTKKAIVLQPEPPAPDPSSLQAQLSQMQGGGAAPGNGMNKSPFPFFQIPLVLKEQVLGVMQVWLQPYVKSSSYAEFITFLTSLATHVEQHLQSRRVGNLVMENQRLQHVLKFSSDLAGALDPLEVSRLSAGYGRDLIGCERCSVLMLHGDRWSVLSISGQEVVEKKSSMVKAMAAFVGAHAHPSAFPAPPPEPPQGGQPPRQELLILSKKELLARAEAAAVANGEPIGENQLPLATRRTDEIDLAYFEHSHVVSAAIAPLFDQDRQLIGAYFAESTTDGFFDSGAAAKESSATQKLTEWLAIHTSKSLQAAQDYNSLPLLAFTRRIRDARLALTGHKRQRVLTRLAVIGAILVVLSLYPKADQIEGNCVVMPQNRSIIVPEVPGRIDKIFVREGQRVSKDEPIAQLDTRRLETEKEAVRQERFRAQAEADRFRGLGDEAAAQVAEIQAGVAENNLKRIDFDIISATLRSPIDGVVLTKDLELRAGEFVQAGTPVAEVAGTDKWDLQMEVSEKLIGRLEKGLAEKTPRNVNFILYSQSAYKLEGTIDSTQQISAVAYPKEKDEVFFITIPNIDVPDHVRSILRPGLTGRAKIQLDREIAIWWVCKRMAEWVQLKYLR